MVEISLITVRPAPHRSGRLAFRGDADLTADDPLGQAKLGDPAFGAAQAPGIGVFPTTLGAAKGGRMVCIHMPSSAGAPWGSRRRKAAETQRLLYDPAIDSQSTSFGLGLCW